MNFARHGAILLGLFFMLAAQAQPVPAGQQTAGSISGQFVIKAGRSSDLLQRFPELKNDPDLMRLDPPLLAVSAERAKDFLWPRVGWKTDAAWNGKVFFIIQPAATLDDPVTITALPFGGAWDYRVELPDVISRTRFARALVGVILLERANSHALLDGGTAAVPNWLVDGLAQQLLAENKDNILLAVPDRVIHGMPHEQMFKRERGVDTLVTTRQVLQMNDALTFDQLSWPDGNQLAGNDGGVYYASAQLFVTELLGLKNASAKLRAMLVQLPAYMNWQTAFYRGFHDDFTRPLDVEKWWSLRVVTFTARDPGPRWTLAVSREKLDALLWIPAEVRTRTNALPVMKEISLPEAIRRFPILAQTGLLENRLRDLQLAQTRLALPYVMLAAEYCSVLADYLGDTHRTIQVGRRAQASVITTRRVAQPEILRRLAVLDARRYELAKQLKLNLTER